MRAIAHGWTPSRMSSPPSRAVAQEFVNADRKYSGGFAENRYWTGGLAAMDEITAGGKRGSLDLFKWQRGGRAGRRRGRVIPLNGETTYQPSPTGIIGPSGSEVTVGTSTPTATAADTPTYDPYYGRGSGTNAWNLPSRYMNWRNWDGPREPNGGGGGPPGDGGGNGTPPPRIIETDPASYIGGSSGASEEGGASPVGPDEASEYREKLRQHQERISAILGSARGGHVNYYEEGGAVRPGHAEGPNPYEGKGMPNAYKQWERKNHIDPPPPPEAAAAEEAEDIPWYKRIAGYGTPTKTDKALAEMEQAYGGRVNYQAGGLAIAAPAGGVPPWIAPTGSGPGYMDEPPPGYQFGGIAARYARPPAAAPATGMGRGNVIDPNTGVVAGGMPGGPPRGGVMGLQRTQPQGGLAAMRQQRMQAQQRGMGNVIDPNTGVVAGGMPGGPGGGGIMDRLGMAGGRFGAEMRRARGMQTYQDVVNRGEGGINPRLPGGGRMYGGDGGGGVAPGNAGTLGGPGYGEYPLGSAGPRMDPSDPSYRAAPPAGGGFQFGKPRPGPGMMPPGGEGGGIPGGPRVPPNMRGYLQKQRMQNRPPRGPVGGGGNRVGMADQQGALSRAMQRGTGRPPMSRRMGFGRAGPTR